MKKVGIYLLFVLLLTSVQNLFAFCGIEVDRVSEVKVLNSKAKALKGTDRKSDFTDVLSKKGIVTEIAFYSPKIVNIRHYKRNCHVKKQNLVVVMPKGIVPLKKTVKAHEMILSSQDLDVAYDRKEGTVRFSGKTGHSYSQRKTIREMRSLTGQVPLMPLWSFGYFQSKERYQSADETAGVVSHYRKIGVSLDGKNACPT